MDNLLNPPPADVALPKAIRDMLTELVAARGRAGAASSAHAWLRRTADQDNRDAAEADRHHVADVESTGSLTPNADALTARRAEAAAEDERTARAVVALERHLLDAIDTHRATGAPAAAVEKATAALAPAADALRAAVTTVAQARALEQWYAGGPYSPTATVGIQALAPVTRTTAGPALLRIPPCDVLAAIDAIAHFTD